MRAKKIGFFLSVLLLSSAFMFTVDASTDTTVTFGGGGVTIGVTFPEEAHPAESIWHNITMSAITTTTLQNFTVIIKAHVNSSWVSIFNAQDTSNQLLPRNYNFNVSLPQETSGTLQCFIYVNTSRIDDLSTVFYTTLVSEPTFSEMQILYEEMLANYTALKANYTTLLNNYNSLLTNYTDLFANYTDLSTEFDAKVAAYQTLSNKYNALLGQYDSLNTNYISKSDAYSALQSDYNDLNSTLNRLQENYTSLQESHNSLQENYTSLKADYDELNQNYDDLRVSTEGALNIDRILMFIFVITLVALIALIIYLKRGKEEPYVVIRKETVNMKQDENPDQSNQT
jgi:hypothetical protein